uniref:Uncharacterized protein n=1 Tax=Anguilla anguilla TaxID=7936 RepID=A0A0E9VCT1_ANGAN
MNAWQSKTIRRNHFKGGRRGKAVIGWHIR